MVLQKIVILFIGLIFLNCSNHHPKESLIIDSFQDPSRIEILLNDCDKCSYLGNNLEDQSVREQLNNDLEMFNSGFKIQSYGSVIFRKYYEEFQDGIGKYSSIRFYKNENDISYIDFVFILKNKEWFLSEIRPYDHLDYLRNSNE